MCEGRGGEEPAWSRGVRLAVDIGGTFTDLVLDTPARRFSRKVLTTPAAPAEAVLAGVAGILSEAGCAPGEVAMIIHGTTLATNAIIERKGVRTALLTTEGFRDVLAMRDESRYDQYDLGLVLPEPLVPRRWRFTVRERLDHEGHPLRPLDEEGVAALVPRLRAEGIESLAIGFLHSYVNPVHERRAREIIAAAWPELPVSLSSEVAPEMREWERFSTTVADAYVQPPIARYLTALAQGLEALGLTAPFFLMLSGGGLATLETACRFPIRLVESGPAGGAIFAAALARARGERHVVSFDMGGTTAKICLIDDFTPQTTRRFEVARVGRFKKGSGLPLRIPVIDMVEIGAGGGSMARIDALGRIQVGPESAGAFPGPACYGRGGTVPTVTDANLLLGRYEAESFAGGRFPLDEGRARTAVGEGVAAPLGLPLPAAALGIIEIVDEAMANAALRHAVESGKDLATRTLIAFGGGGPVHAARLAEKLGIRRILIPAGAGVGSAIGFLAAPIAYEVVRSHYQKCSAWNEEAAAAVIAAMRSEAAAVMEAVFGLGPLTPELRAFMRYVGQGHEVAVPLSPDGGLGRETLLAAFAEAYRAAYGRLVPGSDVEVLSYALRISSLPPPWREETPPLTPARPARRTVIDPARGGPVEMTVLPRAALAPDAVLEGPAILTEPETSTLVPTGWRCRRLPGDVLELTRKEEP